MTAPAVLVPATCELWVDGARFADGQPAESTLDPVALSGLRLTWGRKNSVDQPAPATCSLTVLDPPGGKRFDEVITLGSTVRLYSALGARRVIVFDGRVTDLDASYSDEDGGATVDVVAADLTADLGNRMIGDDPWPAEAMWQRATRIVQLAAAGQRVDVDVRPSAVIVGRMDADRQGAMNLLEDLATTTASVLWSAVDETTGQYLWFEDPAMRPAGEVVIQYDSGLWGPGAASAAGSEIPACQVLQDPVHWVLDTTDLLTRATVRWQDQTTQPDPTERLVTVISAPLEAQHGAKGISVGTLLTTAQAANQLCTALLAAHESDTAWRSSGLTWDLSVSEDNTAATQALALTLLDGNTRIGAPLNLTGLPSWTPTSAATSLFVEGGDYQFEDGHWVLALDTVPSAGSGQSVTYGQMDGSVRQVDMDPGVSYADLVGVGPNLHPVGTPWTSATGTWADATGTWKDYP